LWRWQAAHPRPVDAALAAAVLVAVVWGPFAGGDGGHGHGPDIHLSAPVMDALTIALLAVAAGALVLRRAHPLVVWGVVLVAGIVVLAHGGDPTGAVVPSLLALYTVGSRAPVTTTVAVTAVTVAAYATALTLAEGKFSDRTLSSIAFVGVAAAVGVAVRSQRAAVEAAEARARQAEATREEEADRRVTDERLRIARELHDVVAHHISVVNVQAGVARHLLESQPEQARNALTLVRQASRTVLSEMATVLGLLRTGEEETPTAPAPGLDVVGALVESMRRAGLAVTERSEGKPYELSEIADLAAFRVVQESLTNALKHGTGTAEMVVSYSATAVVVEVRNRVRGHAPTSQGGGHGLVGMRERVTSLGGRFTADAEPEGWFTVRAEIPREGRT
jgi:signal transduction histidine kinase